MKKDNRKDRTDKDRIAVLRSAITVDVSNTIVDKTYKEEAWARCHELVKKKFDTFCRVAGTFFWPELQIASTFVSDISTSQCRLRVALRNDGSYADTGHDIIHLLIKIFGSAIPRPDQEPPEAPYDGFGNDCLALTFYRQKKLTRAEKNALISQLNSLKKTIRLRMQPQLTPVSPGPDFSHITTILKVDDTSVADTEDRPKSTYMHTYTRFPCKIRSLEFGNCPDQVTINDKIYYVYLSGGLLPAVEERIRQFTGERVQLRQLAKRYSKNTTYEVMPGSRDDVDPSEKVLILDRYRIKSIRLQTDRPSVIAEKLMLYYVYFPPSLLSEIESSLTDSLGPEITLREIDHWHDNRRCHRLVRPS